MLNSFPIQLILGTILGFLSGIGIGGGSLLVLYLTLILNMSPAEARIINVLFFLPASAVSCLLRFRKESLSVRPLLPAIGAGCSAALLFSQLGSTASPEVFEKLFGVILLLAGLREVFYRPRKDR